jgi:hypothetical protein
MGKSSAIALYVGMNATRAQAAKRRFTASPMPPVAPVTSTAAGTLAMAHSPRGASVRRGAHSAASVMQVRVLDARTRRQAKLGLPLA